MQIIFESKHLSFVRWPHHDRASNDPNAAEEHKNESYETYRPERAPHPVL